jgi:hypothetical protein
MNQKGPITFKFSYDKMNLDPVPLSIIKSKNGKNGSQNPSLVDKVSMKKLAPISVPLFKTKDMFLFLIHNSTLSIRVQQNQDSVYKI